MKELNIFFYFTCNYILLMFVFKNIKILINQLKLTINGIHIFFLSFMLINIKVN